jgi:hypothetical protein
VKVVLRGANKLGIAMIFLLFVFGSGISMLLAHVTERGRMENCCHATVCVLVAPETISPRISFFSYSKSTLSVTFSFQDFTVFFS